MKCIQVEGRTLPEAYHTALLALNNLGEISQCKDWDTTQKELSITIHVREPLAEPRISKCFIGGPEELEQYKQEMLYGILDFEVERGNWAYTYHQRMAEYPVTFLNKRSLTKINQINFVIKELQRNPSSRRAVIMIRDVFSDTQSDDPACLQHIQFFIRDNKLDCLVLFRSNDACKATFMNAFALIELQKLIADQLKVEVGTYTHRANSFHCYEKDFNMLEGYCKGISSQEDMTYEYKGWWQELAEDFAKNELPEKIKKLKERTN